MFGKEGMQLAPVKPIAVAARVTRPTIYFTACSEQPSSSASSAAIAHLSDPCLYEPL
jgi:hypothetical protein